MEVFAKERTKTVYMVPPGCLTIDEALDEVGYLGEEGIYGVPVDGAEPIPREITVPTLYGRLCNFFEERMRTKEAK